MKKGYIIGGIIVIVMALLIALFLMWDRTDQSDTTQSEENEMIENEVEETTDEEEKVENDSSEEESAQSDESDEQETPTQEEPVEKNEKNDDVVIENGYIQGQTLPTEPTYVDGVLIANKKYPLPKDFAPGENPEARAAFEMMAQDAKKEGIELVAFSTYRSFEYQQTLYDRYVARDGKNNADRYSARPGYSEHQTGLAFDIGEKGREDIWLTEQFGESEAGKWLLENAHKYGFILRYPKGKEQITGYMYESWHFRYLGVELATKVKESGLTLEEYLGID